LAKYAYDAHGWRIQETHGSTTTDLYYSNRWKVIEERQSGTVTDQYVWSRAYTDCLVLRDDNSSTTGGGVGTVGRRLYAQQDANWNTTALVDAGGNVQERFVYDPYGNVTVLNASGTATTTDGYNWNYFQQGGRLDLATSLYLFRHRDYSSSSGVHITGK
jgi:YD repeat-containing protein